MSHPLSNVPEYALSVLLKHQQNKPQEQPKRNEKKRTLLHWACLLDQPEIATILLDTGFYVNQQDEDGNTPLHLAIQNIKEKSHKKIIELLYRRGASNLIENNQHILPSGMSDLSSTMHIDSSVIDGLLRQRMLPHMDRPSKLHVQQNLQNYMQESYFQAHLETVLKKEVESLEKYIDDNINHDFGFEFIEIDEDLMRLILKDKQTLEIIYQLNNKSKNDYEKESVEMQILNEIRDQTKISSQKEKDEILEVLSDTQNQKQSMTKLGLLFLWRSYEIAKEYAKDIPDLAEFIYRKSIGIARPHIPALPTVETLIPKRLL